MLEKFIRHVNRAPDNLSQMDGKVRFAQIASGNVAARLAEPEKSASCRVVRIRGRSGTIQRICLRIARVVRGGRRSSSTAPPAPRCFILPNIALLQSWRLRGAGLKFFQHCQAMRALTVGREPCRNVRGMKMLSLKHGDGMAPVAKALEPDTRGGGLNPRHGLCVFCLPSVG